MIHSFRNGRTTSVRFYAAVFENNHIDLKMKSVQMQIPIGCARFNDEFHEFDW